MVEAVGSCLGAASWLADEVAVRGDPLLPYTEQRNVGPTPDGSVVVRRKRGFWCRHEKFSIEHPTAIGQADGVYRSERPR